MGLERGYGMAFYDMEEQKALKDSRRFSGVKEVSAEYVKFLYEQ